jgi:hypothetical protein
VAQLTLSLPAGIVGKKALRSGVSHSIAHGDVDATKQALDRIVTEPLAPHVGRDAHEFDRRRIGAHGVNDRVRELHTLNVPTDKNANTEATMGVNGTLA